MPRGDEGLLQIDVPFMNQEFVYEPWSSPGTSHLRLPESGAGGYGSLQEALAGINSRSAPGSFLDRFQGDPGLGIAMTDYGAANQPSLTRGGPGPNADFTLDFRGGGDSFRDRYFGDSRLPGFGDEGLGTNTYSGIAPGDMSGTGQTPPSALQWLRQPASPDFNQRFAGDNSFPRQFPGHSAVTMWEPPDPGLPPEGPMYGEPNWDAFGPMLIGGGLAQDAGMGDIYRPWGGAMALNNGTAPPAPSGGDPGGSFTPRQPTFNERFTGDQSQPMQMQPFTPDNFQGIGGPAPLRGMDEFSSQGRGGFGIPYVSSWDQPPADMNEAYRPGMDPRGAFERGGGLSGFIGDVAGGIQQGWRQIADTPTGGFTPSNISESFGALGGFDPTTADMAFVTPGAGGFPQDSFANRFDAAASTGRFGSGQETMVFPGVSTVTLNPDTGQLSDLPRSFVRPGGSDSFGFGGGPATSGPLPHPDFEGAFAGGFAPFTPGLEPYPVTPVMQADLGPVGGGGRRLGGHGDIVGGASFEDRWPTMAMPTFDPGMNWAPDYTGQAFNTGNIWQPPAPNYSGFLAGGTSFDNSFAFDPYSPATIGTGSDPYGTNQAPSTTSFTGGQQFSEAPFMGGTSWQEASLGAPVMNWAPGGGGGGGAVGGSFNGPYPVIGNNSLGGSGVTGTNQWSAYPSGNSYMASGGLYAGSGMYGLPSAGPSFGAPPIFTVAPGPVPLTFGPSGGLTPYGFGFI